MHGAKMPFYFSSKFSGVFITDVDDSIINESLLQFHSRQFLADV